MTDEPTFAEQTDAETVENGMTLSPKFGSDGLITAVVVDATRGDVLMVAHMDRTALARTIETGQAWFWSRSRQRYWRKGEESGNTLSVTELRVDCDQDTILVKASVAGDGVVCHLGYRSCFYRSVPIGQAPGIDTRLQPDSAMPRKT